MQNQQKQTVKHESTAWQPTFECSHKSFIQRSYNHIKSSQSLTLGAKGWIPFVSSSKIKWFIKKIIFWLTVFIAINIIQVIVFYGKESTDFIHYLCQTKFNDWLGLFLYE